MAANSSSSSNDSDPKSCLQIRPYSFILPLTVFIIILFLLPLYVFILHRGLQQWRKKAPISHSDCFTYDIALKELVNIIGEVVYVCGHLQNNDVIIYWGNSVIRFSSFGILSVHLLTCVERYLAVVHPITYMRLRNRKGIRIRNVCIVCVWMFSGAYTFLSSMHYADQWVLVITIAAVSFLSLSVLLVLVRPGPGERGGNRQWADPSKKRAFFTIVAILGALELKLSGTLCYIVAFLSNSNVTCVIEVLLLWMQVPNNLVLPLLFLHRRGRRNKQ